jgi:hypothetical protein
MAYTVSTTVGPTELGGQYRITAKKVSPDDATGSVTFTEFDTVHAVLGFAFAEDLTANCYSADVQINGSTANQVDFKLWKAGGTAADTAFLDFWVTVLAS